MGGIQFLPKEAPVTDADIMARLGAYIAEEAANEPPRRPGRGAMKRPRARARERLARELHMSPETLRKKEWEASQRRCLATDPVHPVDDLGQQLTPEFRALVAKAQWYLDSAHQCVRKAVQRLTEMQRDIGNDLPPGMVAALRERLDAAGAGLLGARPSSLCKACLGQEGRQESCATCGGSGFTSREDESDEWGVG